MKNITACEELHVVLNVTNVKRFVAVRGISYNFYFMVKKSWNNLILIFINSLHSSRAEANIFFQFTDLQTG